MFENFVVQETIKKFHNSGIRPNLYFLRTSNGVEVDLLIEKSTKLYPFEIKLTKTPNLGMAKNMEQFLKLFGKQKPEKGKIICLSEENFALTKNVSVVPMVDYL